MIAEKEALDRLKKACEDLGEHFDTVQIFATLHVPGDNDDAGTGGADWGTGNWYTRKGQVEDWIIRQNERTRVNERGGT